MRQRFFSSPWLSMAPALLLVTVLFGASMIYGIVQSLGYISFIGQQEVSLQAYKNLLFGEGIAGREFWTSLGFSLWISTASTLISAAAALGIAVLLTERRRTNQGADTLALNWNLAFPHLVWAVALLLFLSQSGLLARWAATLGWISTPADFPVLVNDRFGFGIILHYVSKEIPFLTLIILAVLRAQPAGFYAVAANLGAGRWQTLRYVTFPMVKPALLSGSLLVFAFVFSSYEVAALLGVRYPRALSVLALEAFTNPDLRSRAEGMAISLIITAIVLLVAIISIRRGEQGR
jgi:putative spermidine/putrescine transport system permease protein